MRRSSAGRFAVIGLLTFVAARCGSSPTSPSTTTAIQATPAAAAPAVQANISSVLPAVLPPSTSTQTLIITGTNFQQGLIASFAQAPSSSASKLTDSTQTFSGSAIQNLTDTSFQISVAVSGAGTYTVSVTNPSSTPSTPATVTADPNAAAGPTIAGFSPGSPSQSSAAQPVYIAGTNFQPGLTVTLTAPSGAAATIDTSAISWGSPTTFQMVVTLAEAGAYSVRVVNPSGQTSDAKSLTVNAAATPPTPAVVGISPATPTATSAVQTINVAGTGFASGLSVLLTDPTGATTSLSGSAIQNITSTGFQLNVVLGATGSDSLRVVNLSGQSSAPWTFTVKATEVAGPPSISSVQPASPTQGAAPQTVYVNGASFQTGVTAKLTSPSGTTTSLSGSSIAFGSSSVFQMTVTLGDAGTYAVQAVNPDGQVSSSVSFTVQAQAAPPTPSLTGLSPRSPTVASVAQTILIVGTNFAAGLSVVLIGPDGATTSISGSAIQSLTSTQFQLNVVLGVTGSYSLRVVNPSGQSSTALTLNVQAAAVASPPSISGVQPVSPTQSTAPQSVSLSGANFQTGLTVKLTSPSGATTSVAGTSIAFGSSSAFQMTVTLGTPGAYTVQVVNPDGQSSAVMSFSVTAPATNPTIAGLSPRSPTLGTASQTVFVGGTNFAAGLSVVLIAPDGTTTTIGGSAVTGLTSTGFQFTTVIGTAGSWSLRVSNPTGPSSDPFAFTVKAPAVASPPAVTSTSPVSPTQSTAAQEVYVLGTNFQSGLTVLLTSPSGVTSTISGSAITYSLTTTFEMNVTLGDAGTYSVRVTNPDGNSSQALSFTVAAFQTSPTPTIVGISPKSPTASTAIQTIPVGGTNFATGLTLLLTGPDGSTTTIGGTAITITSSTLMQFNAVLGVAGNYSLRVANPSGQTSAPWAFTVKSGS